MIKVILYLRGGFKPIHSRHFTIEQDQWEWLANNHLFFLSLILALNFSQNAWLVS